jgi:cytochrome c
MMVRRFVTIAAVAAAVAGWAQAASAAGDAANGEKIFKKCATCHGIGDTKKPVGPNLTGVIGRTAGTQADFVDKYSKAMKEAGAAGLVWTEAEIDVYITDPKKKVPGNKMAFPGLKKPEERADVIAYIKTFSPATQ